MEQSPQEANNSSVVKSPHFMEPDDLLLCSRQPDTDEFQSMPFNPFSVKIQCNSILQVFWPPSCFPNQNHACPLSLSCLIWSPEYYLVGGTNHEASHEIVACILFPPLRDISPVPCFQHSQPLSLL